MEPRIWRAKADPLKLIRVQAEDPNGVCTCVGLGSRPGQHGETCVLSKAELVQNWEPATADEWESAQAMPERDADRIPDLPGIVYGYRAWMLDPLCNLWSMGVGNSIWEPGRNVALCRVGRGEPHRPPMSNCSCGFYGYHDTEELELFLPEDGSRLPVVGVIKAWGDIEVHHHGFRAEYAEIVALCAPTEEVLKRQEKAWKGHRPGPLPDLRQVFGQALDRYKVELLPASPEAMREWVAEQKDGGSIPAEGRPEINEQGPEVFWASDRKFPSFSLTNTGQVIVKDKVRLQIEAFQVRPAASRNVPLPPDFNSKNVFFGEALFPGYSKREKAVAHLPMNFSQRVELRWGVKLRWFFIIWFAASAILQTFFAVRAGIQLAWERVALDLVIVAFNLWLARREIRAVRR